MIARLGRSFRTETGGIEELICYFISGVGFVAWVIISLVRSIEDRPFGPDKAADTADRNTD